MMNLRTIRAEDQPEAQPSRCQLIDEQHEPRVMDSGLAKKFMTDSDLTMSGQLLGSPNFLLREQASARRGKVGRTAAVWNTHVAALVSVRRSSGAKGG